MEVRVGNAQRAYRVDTARMAACARRTVTQLDIRTPGMLVITFLDGRRMRALNRRFLRHDRGTDVLSFRYDGEPVVGEIFVCPDAARRYARAHGLAYTTELARYVVHGVLHWLGHEDRTAAGQQRMRTLENRLLARCQEFHGRRGEGDHHSHAPPLTPHAPVSY